VYAHERFTHKTSLLHGFSLPDVWRMQLSSCQVLHGFLDKQYPRRIRPLNRLVLFATPLRLLSLSLYQSIPSGSFICKKWFYYSGTLVLLFASPFMAVYASPISWFLVLRNIYSLRITRRFPLCCTTHCSSPYGSYSCCAFCMVRWFCCRPSSSALFSGSVP